MSLTAQPGQTVTVELLDSDAGATVTARLLGPSGAELLAGLPVTEVTTGRHTATLTAPLTPNTFTVEWSSVYNDRPWVSFDELDVIGLTDADQLEDAATLGATLLAADDPQTTPAQALAAVAAELLGDPEQVSADLGDLTEAPGYSWSIDPDQRRLHRTGLSGVKVTGVDCVAQRCTMAVHSARLAHRSLPTGFGTDQPYAPLGTAPDEQDIAELGRRLSEALLAVEGVVAVENFQGVAVGPAIEITLDVLTDVDDQAVRMRELITDPREQT